MGPSLTTAENAQQALRLAAVDPHRAMLLAEIVVKDGADPGASSVAERALGLAHRELLELPEARRHLRRAIRLAERAELPERAAEARLSLALEHLHDGQPRAALRELAAAADVLGDGHAQIHNQIAGVYVRLGRYQVAHASADRAVSAAERDGDRSLLALSLTNHAIAAAYCGDLRAAEVDLRRAIAICEELGEALGACDGLHNLAWVLGRGGDLPAALELYDRAERGIAALGVPLSAYQLDRCEALLAAGLMQEALALADAAVLELEQAGMWAAVPEALLLRTRAALALGDRTAAVRDARQAARRFTRQGRRGWAALSKSLELQALASARPTPALVRAAVQVADMLRRSGWPDVEVEARLVAARAAHSVGDLHTESAQLLLVSGRRTATSARLRSLAWLAEATLRSRAADRTGALRATRAGLRELRVHAAALGSTELHAAAARDAGAIGELAIDLALSAAGAASVRAAGCLDWTEQLRATTLHRPPLRPPLDAELASDLTSLRAVEAELRELMREGDASPAALLRRRGDVEASIRRRSHHTRGAQVTSTTAPALPTLRRMLGDRLLVSFFEHRGRLLAVVVARRRSEVVDCGPASAVARELQHLSFALRRAVSGDAAAGAVLTASAVHLDLLLAPALAGAHRAGLVVVPTGPLHALPWSLLPTLAGVAVEVAPSVALWARPARPGTRSAVVAVAGPGLTAADGEVADLVAVLPGTRALLGAEASCAAVLLALDDAAVAHLACHAVFRSDNPLFSALLLADGPLTVYDLERLRSSPDLVVLSACDSGRIGVRAGDELLGLAAAFFALGTRTLVASVVPVQDAATRRLMAGFHHELVQGVDPSRALATAAAHVGDEPADRATAAAFVCLRAGQ